MTDIAVAPTLRKYDVQSDEARARVRKRYASERRFQAYGIAAIVFAGLFLVVLIADIVMKGYPAFLSHHVTLSVTVTPDVADPGGARRPEDIARGDFDQLVRDSFRALFPQASDRASRRLVDNLLSSGAAAELRRRVLADPGLIGQNVQVSALLSDEADLHFKGDVTPIRQDAGRGQAGPSGTTGQITIFSSSNDFGDEVVRIKDSLRRLADKQAIELRGRERLLATITRPEERTGLAAQVEEQRARIADYRARASGTAAEKLDETLPSILVAINGGLVKVTEIGNDRITGDVLLPLETAEPANPGRWQVRFYDVPESSRKVTDREIAFLEALKERNLVERVFNWAFFVSGDSREAEIAGVLGGIVGSALTLLVTLGICLPVGVLAAIYLEEFAPKNLFTNLVEVSINNLAAVPSIVFGLLGLAVFLNAFGMPRSSPLVGGLVLALLVLPTIIIASRAALKAVPPSIREAALGVGASHQQAVFQHVLPLAMPGIMTGTIIGMAHALGETAPLLMIGMVAFIVDIPGGVTDAATALPVQIFLWSDLPEIAFQAKTAAAIMVLLVFLFVMNGLAIWLRKRFERRW